MILPKKKSTEELFWEGKTSLQYLTKKDKLDSSAQKELADYFEMIIYDENLTASKRTKMLQEGLKFLRDE